MRKTLLLGLALGAGAMIGVGALPALSQPYGQRYDPPDSFFNFLDRNTTNRALNCSISKRINREGDIVWLRMDCRAP